jgi:serine/threonine-protein kinase RsbW
MTPLTVPGTLDSLTLIRQHVWAAAANAGIDRKRTYRLELAVDEVASNIINHGYIEAGRTGDITVRAAMSAEALTITLEDTGEPFDPRCLERPEQLDLPLAERPIGGLGVFLAIENVDEFCYEYADEHNRNIFVMKRVAS